MPEFLDSLPYPWVNPVAQELHRVLCQIHPTGQAALFVARKVGLDTTMIFAEQPVFYLWRDILDEACRHGALRSLIQEVSDRLAATSPFKGYLAELLQDRPPPVADEPRQADGAPKFISGTDDVFEPEALLYRDDLTLQIGKVPGLIDTLKTLLTLSPAVCKLNVNLAGTTKTGTGFRVGADLLLTNWHVLHHIGTGARATGVAAEFLYEDDRDGVPTAAKIIRCDVSTIHTDKDDDWAVIRTTDLMEDSWPVIPMDAAVTFKEGDPAYIIQHPAGQRKRLGFVRNQVSFIDDRVTHYLTDTQEGSSGSPVLDREGRLFALHHAGGRPQEVVGRAPLRKNEGIRISRVVAGLKAAGVL
ncbi:trypsin-like peptidase [Roseimicrobium gellanilyticum]|uniref:Serine protease n=1 Tax=Roseimicrobium gellanilyticum TaxID=748857 RepID=A0A366H954_9BACT|nr:serine protease [Roseimicrobium gellanilyticum]RBP38644.1 trypsin-like peptidase [Roseimicrobium gellanilyticum]